MQKYGRAIFHLSKGKEMNKMKYRILILSLFVISLLVVAPGAYCQSGVEVSTDELKAIFAGGKAHVFDVRPAKEYAISHIPGSINIYENELERMMELCPDKASEIVLYCNGIFCHKSIRVAEQLVKKEYVNVKRYQQGLPVWRAFGNTAETDLSGFKYVFENDKSAVFVDARLKGEFEKGTLPGAVNMKIGETEEANKDGRLPYNDHGTRLIVFGENAAQARELAEEIAHRAYWNSSYFSGTFQDLKQASFR
jgi:rhodanese-related sulfurtransferase